jgi:hypothetical protein
VCWHPLLTLVLSLHLPAPPLLLLLLRGCESCLPHVQIVMGTFIISFIGNSFISSTIDSQVRVEGSGLPLVLRVLAESGS